MKIFLLALLTTWFTSLSSQDLEIYETYDEYSSNLTPDDETIYVVNYWATWCAPCVKELPYFEELNSTYKKKNVEVVLVSIDFSNHRERRLIPFIQKKGLQSRLIHLVDPKTNDWIDRVDPSWSGAIPATVFVQGEKSLFMEKQFPSFESLQEELEAFIKS